MHLKQEIGQRITAARKAKNLTRKALAELTEDLKPSRINNWERGIRTPGPEEIKQLAKALTISPAYLMGLLDHNPAELSSVDYIPLLTHTEAANFSNTLKNYHLIPVGNTMQCDLGSSAFALTVKDNSMAPELRPNDVLFISTQKPSKPGDFVIAKLMTDDEVIIRQYKPLSAEKNSHPFELLAVNSYWPTLYGDSQTKLIGTVCAIQRAFL